MRHQTQKLRIVNSLTGGADLILPNAVRSNTTIAVRVYDTRRITRLEVECRNRSRTQTRSRSRKRKLSEEGEKEDDNGNINGNINGNTNGNINGNSIGHEKDKGGDFDDDDNDDDIKQSFRDSIQHVLGESNPQCSSSSVTKFDYDFDKVRTFRDAYQYPVVFFLLPIGGNGINWNMAKNGNGNGKKNDNGVKMNVGMRDEQLNRVDSVFKLLQSSLGYFPRRDGDDKSGGGNGSSRRFHDGCARTFIVPDYSSILKILLVVQESLTQDKCDRKELFFQKEAERLLVPLPQAGESTNEQISTKAAMRQVTAVFHAWAQSRGISTTDANVIMDAMGSMENIITANEQSLEYVPVEGRVKKQILSFFGGGLSKIIVGAGARAGTRYENYVVDGKEKRDCIPNGSQDEIDFFDMQSNAYGIMESQNENEIPNFHDQDHRSEIPPRQIQQPIQNEDAYGRSQEFGFGADAANNSRSGNFVNRGHNHFMHGTTTMDNSNHRFKSHSNLQHHHHITNRGTGNNATISHFKENTFRQPHSHTHQHSIVGQHQNNSLHRQSTVTSSFFGQQQNQETQEPSVPPSNLMCRSMSVRNSTLIGPDAGRANVNLSCHRQGILSTVRRHPIDGGETNGHNYLNRNSRMHGTGTSVAPMMMNQRNPQSSPFNRRPNNQRLTERSQPSSMFGVDVQLPLDSGTFSENAVSTSDNLFQEFHAFS